MKRPLRVVRRDGPLLELDDGTIVRLLGEHVAPAVGDLVTVGEAKIHAPATELDRLAARGAN